MFKVGRARRNLQGAVNHYRTGGDRSSAFEVVAGKARPDHQGRPQKLLPPPNPSQYISPLSGAASRASDTKGKSQEQILAERVISAATIDAIACPPGQGGGLGNGGGGIGLGTSAASQTYFNAIVDDLSKGSVAEQWVPLDTLRQNQMWRMMYVRGNIEGPVVDTMVDLCWEGDFEFVGIKDPEILDTLYASKEATQLSSNCPFISRDYLVIGRAIAQLFLNQEMGIWQDLTIYNPDFVAVAGQPRATFQPKLDLLPDPRLQAWAKSTDKRDIDAQKGLPKKLLDALRSQAPVPLDPRTTAYLPRRAAFNDIDGVSFYSRNINFWALEKSMIDATLQGHRRRAGPVMQVKVGSADREAEPAEKQAYIDALLASESDNVLSAIATAYDVDILDIRSSLADMWQWSQAWLDINTQRYHMFGVSEGLITGETPFDLTSAPTVFIQRLAAHRRYITEHFILQKFCKGLAAVHQWRKRTPAELAHRIRINSNEDYDLILPTIQFHRRLDQNADPQRIDLLEKREEKGLPVTMEDWNRATGGAGTLKDQFRDQVQDLRLRLQAMQLVKLRMQIKDLESSAGDAQNLGSEVRRLLDAVHKLKFVDDDEAYDLEKMTDAAEDRAADINDGVDMAEVTQANPEVVAHIDDGHSTFVPNTKMYSDPETDLLRWTVGSDKVSGNLNKPGSAF